MSRSSRATRRPALSRAAALLAAGCAAAFPILPMTAMANEMADDILLRVTGAEGVEVAGECSLRTTEGERALRFSRTVPFEERLAGQGVRCRFDVAGRAEIEFRMNGNVSRTRTSGGVVRVSIGS